VVVSRAAGSAAFPARFQLVGAANYCRRGCVSLDACVCTPGERQQYLSRLSRPLLDRIDLHLEVRAVPYAELSGGGGESSKAIRSRVEMARHRQSERLAGSGARVNARMSGRQVRRFCAPPPEATELLQQAVSRLGLSARGHDRVLKVARTIADLAGCERIVAEHVSEAVQYRGLDRCL
jgi:magnesium chelatase family protein